MNATPLDAGGPSMASQRIDVRCTDAYEVREVMIEAGSDAAALRAAADLLEQDDFAGHYDIENIRFDEAMDLQRVLLVLQLRVLTSRSFSTYLDVADVLAPAAAAEVADAPGAADDVSEGRSQER